MLQESNKFCWNFFFKKKAFEMLMDFVKVPLHSLLSQILSRLIAQSKVNVKIEFVNSKNLHVVKCFS